MTEQVSYSLRNRILICKVVLIGTYVLVAIVAMLLWISVHVDGNSFVFGRLVICLLSAAYISGTYILLKAKKVRAVALMLLLFYGFLASAMIWIWSVDTPVALLLFGLVIVQAGILLTARAALFAAIFSGLILVAAQTLDVLQWHIPNTSWVKGQPSFGDVAGYCTVFGMLALICWLYSREMERSLEQAQQAQNALLRQKTTLKRQVRLQANKLQEAQLEEMRQLYRFADLGQLGIILLHDLANHLTALSLEIDGLRDQQQSDELLTAKKITRYLEKTVQKTRDRLYGTAPEEHFSLGQQISEVVEFLQYKSSKMGVTLIWRRPKHSLTYFGDANSLAQIVTIVVSNAIDAYDDSPTKRKNVHNNHKREVEIIKTRYDTKVEISVTNWGRPLSPAKRRTLFQPFRSSKEHGLGIGLFLARQLVEMKFGGSITLDPNTSYTRFTITLPCKNP